MILSFQILQTLRKLSFLSYVGTNNINAHILIFSKSQSEDFVQTSYQCLVNQKKDFWFLRIKVILRRSLFVQAYTKTKWRK